MIPSSVGLPLSATMPLSALLETLRGWPDPLTLSACLPSRPEWATPHATAWVQVRHGRVQACTIVQAHGPMLLQGEAALAYLAQAGTLRWQVTPMLPNQSPIRPRRAEDALGVMAHPPASLSRRHRQLLLLVDGRKTVPELARLLHLTPQEVETLLHDLRKYHVLI